MVSFISPCASFSRRINCTSSLNPLEHRRVLVTAPAQYAARLLPRLIERHARPIHAPLICTKPLSESLAFDLEEAILRLSEYDIVAFTSRTGIRSFAEKIRTLCETDEQASLMLRASGVRIAALGADGSAVSEYLHVAPDILPPDPSPSGLVDFLALDLELKGSRILCPIPKVVNLPEPPVVPNFLRGLKEAGFRVKSVAAYVTSPLERVKVEVEIEMLQKGHIDAVLVSSQGEANALYSLLSESERSALLEQLNSGQVLLAAHGPYTAAGISEVFGIESIVVSQNWASFQGVVDALETKFAEISVGDGLILPV
ncbi:putative uroporphyrinogen-III synthase [Gracilariopsis chorda]|uniref:Putative uroporphyrinogen-III synthase n=1 Tax=Gracilariopsis chorda TaxID=448386 RepID=A0A2V3ITD8_9FLOR|nr:putative uroporphyrinogen-III synthase [Gracilariopsis chorda]|eukprot:PXF44380.1 putative uroporphyrinogen-III synthase [Gracilariopsis chorda]